MLNRMMPPRVLDELVGAETALDFAWLLWGLIGTAL